MNIIYGYFEIYDLTMAIYYVYNTSSVEKALKVLGVDFKPSKELTEFKTLLTENMDWSTRIYTTFMNELGVIAPILFPVKIKMKDRSIVTIEDTLCLSKEHFEKIRERFIKVLAVRRLNTSFKELANLLEEDPNKVRDKVDEISGISDNSRWFINQLLFFPDTARDFLDANTERLLKLYEESELRNRNLSSVKKFIENTTREKVIESITNYFDYYGLSPDSTKPLYVALQNSVSRTNSGLMSYPSFHLLVLGIEEITQDFAKKIPTEERMQKLIKVIGDKTRFEILRYISNKPSTQKELVKHTRLSKSTISYHTSLLFKASLIDIDVFNNVAHVRKDTFKRVLGDLRKLLKLGDSK
jgi:DNA-binding transcriptional ArsR family regulator